MVLVILALFLMKAHLMGVWYIGLGMIHGNVAYFDITS